MNIIEILKEKNLTISSAESITAGLIASDICSISGASNYFKGGIVAYTKEAKANILKLDMADIEKYGVYSYETVIKMAQNAQKILKSDLAIATSGVAGPGSDEGVKEGTVYFAIAIKDDVKTYKEVFSGTRNEIRKKASTWAIDKICDLLTK